MRVLSYGDHESHDHELIAKNGMVIIFKKKYDMVIVCWFVQIDHLPTYTHHPAKIIIIKLISNFLWHYVTGLCNACI